MNMHRTLLIALLLCVAGCERAAPSPDPLWRIELLRPDGATQQVWTVRHPVEPQQRALWGGQIRLYLRNGMIAEPTELYAPAGWCFVITRKE